MEKRAAPLTAAERNRRYRERQKTAEDWPERSEKIRERTRAHYAANRQAILARHKANYEANPEPQRKYSRDRAARDRREFLDAYGGRCACCGETEPRFLCLDHVNRDGVRDRAATGGRNTGIIRRLKKQGWPKDGYRLLCANCNTATAWGRVCPHQEKENSNA